MITDALTRLQLSRVAAERTQSDRALYAAAVAEFEASGWWSAADLAEYREIAAQVMKNGTDDEKAAAREFWQDRSGWLDAGNGINQRIRNSLEDERRAA